MVAKTGTRRDCDNCKHKDGQRFEGDVWMCMKCGHVSTNRDATPLELLGVFLVIVMTTVVIILSM